VSAEMISTGQDSYMTDPLIEIYDEPIFARFWI
ncbi:uncharacterized protein METZ01_LOCUS431744, partial [marine metagenome]